MKRESVIPDMFERWRTIQAPADVEAIWQELAARDLLTAETAELYVENALITVAMHRDDAEARPFVDYAAEIGQRIAAMRGDLDAVPD